MPNEPATEVSAPAAGLEPLAQRHAIESSARLLRTMRETDRFIRVTGPSGANKSVVVREALHGRRSVWIDIASAPTPDALVASLAHALGLPPGPTPMTIDAARRALEVSGSVLVMDGCDGPLGALETVVMKVLGARTGWIVIGHAPETRLIPLATLALREGVTAAPAAEQLRGPERAWLEALALLGGGLSYDDAAALGRDLGVADASARLDLLARVGALVVPDPHDPKRVRIPGRVREVLTARPQRLSTRAATSAVALRARWATDDAVDFEDYPRRLGLLHHATPTQAMALLGAVVRWSSRWQLGTVGQRAMRLLEPWVGRHSEVRALQEPSYGSTETARQQLAQAERLARSERWTEAVQGFEAATNLLAQSGLPGLTATQNALFGWSLVELGRHDEAGRYLARADSGTTGDVRGEPSTARALAFLDRGLYDDAESRLSQDALGFTLKGKKRAGAQARFWLLCATALREPVRSGSTGATADIEPFHARVVADELQQVGEPALSAFASALSAWFTGELPRLPQDAERHPATTAAVRVLRGERPDDTAPGILVRVAQRIVDRR